MIIKAIFIHETQIAFSYEECSLPSENGVDLSLDLKCPSSSKNREGSNFFGLIKIVLVECNRIQHGYYDSPLRYVISFEHGITWRRVGESQGSAITNA